MNNFLDSFMEVLVIECQFLGKEKSDIKMRCVFFDLTLLQLEAVMWF